jgi:hypothetical protein
MSHSPVEKELIPGKSNYPAAAALCEQVKVLNSIWRSLNGGLRLKVSFAALTGVASSAGRSSFTEKWSTAQFNSNIFTGDFSRRFTLHNGANLVLLLRSKTPQVTLVRAFLKIWSKNVERIELF